MISLKLIADFYFLNAVCMTTPEFGNKPQETTHRKARRAFGELSKILANVMHDYLFLACIGEARHAHSKTSSDGWYFYDLPKTRSRSTAVEMGLEYDPEPTLKQMAALFGEQTWSPSHGGDAWANVCRSTLLYYEVPPPVFVDHIVSVKHNGGTAFDKPQARSLAGLDGNALSKEDWLRLGGMSGNLFLDWKANAKNLLLDHPPVLPKEWTPYPDGFVVTKRTYYILRSWYRTFERRSIPYWIDRNGTVWPESVDRVEFGTKVPTQRVDKELERIREYVSSYQNPSPINPQSILEESDKLIYKEGKVQELPEGVSQGEYTYIQ